MKEIWNGIQVAIAAVGGWIGYFLVGFLEMNPALDIEGWDTAMKTVILANSFWGKACTLGDVNITGIQDLTKEDVDAAAAKGRTWCMVGRAVQQPDGGLYLSTEAVSLPANDPLARADWRDKVLCMKTRSQGEQVHYSLGASASGTPGCIYNDLILAAKTL